MAVVVVLSIAGNYRKEQGYGEFEITEWVCISRPDPRGEMLAYGGQAIPL
jgi:hypothetical protein